MFGFNYFGYFNRTPRYEPPPNPDRPLLRTKEYHGGAIVDVTVRDKPKINRKRELKARNAALRAWKRKAGIKGRMNAEAHRVFVQFWNSMIGSKDD